MKRVVVAIEGMSCGHCLNAVNQALGALPAARVAAVRIGRAEVELADDGEPAAVVAAVEQAGYRAMLVEGA